MFVNRLVSELQNALLKKLQNVLKVEFPEKNKIKVSSDLSCRQTSYGSYHRSVSLLCCVKMIVPFIPEK